VKELLSIGIQPDLALPQRSLAAAGFEKENRAVCLQHARINLISMQDMDHDLRGAGGAG